MTTPVTEQSLFVKGTTGHACDKCGGDTTITTITAVPPRDGYPKVNHHCVKCHGPGDKGAQLLKKVRKT